MALFPVTAGTHAETEAPALARIREHLRVLRRECDLEFYERVDLRAWTVLRMGGLADLLVRCNSVDAVQEVVDLCASHGVTWLSLGAGTRLVAPEKGLRVPVVCLGGGLAAVEVENKAVTAGAGANLTQMCRAAARSGLAGMERFFGTQESLGGALVSMGKVRSSRLLESIDWIEVVRPGSGLVRHERRDSTSVFARGPDGRLRSIVVRARFTLLPDGLAVINARLGRAARIQNRPAGSLDPVFEDPGGVMAVELLRDAGCGSLSIGGARVCDRHPNRILASRRTSAEEVMTLCRQMRERVLKRFGVDLAPAACLVDEYGRIEML